MHRRAELACAAAVDTGVAGRFRVWEQAGLLAVSATHPALDFLSVVTGVSEETVPAAIALAEEPVWGNAEPTVVVSAELVEKLLLNKGFVRAEDRLLATRRLEREAVADGVTEVDEHDTFARVLLAGFEADGVVADFIRAEHGLPAMRRFVILEEKKPIAAAAMTIHDDVAVLGAASTLPAHRGKGAQTRLLRHRLVIAAETCSLAVATARPGSTSAANLGRAGFRLHRRAAWRKSRETGCGTRR